MSFTRLSIRSSPGALFRSLVATARPTPLPILGAPNAYSALLAAHAGAQALYLSGSSLATVSLGLPDLSAHSAADVADDCRRITGACALPLLVDVDTGLGDSALAIRRTIALVERAGACGVHLEDQRLSHKRCGHRPHKAIVPIQDMVDRLRAAVEARDDPAFVVMARTDALASETLPEVVDRCRAYVEAGADMVFVEAARELGEYRAVREGLGGAVPVLANVTEWGVSPQWTLRELGEAGVAMALYPVSAQRAMARAALRVYEAVLREGSVRRVQGEMQSREELYDILGYARYEQEMDDKK